MIHDHQPPRIEPSKRAGIFLLVVLLHLLLLYWLAMFRGEPLPAAPQFPSIKVTLFSAGGGGAPAADSTASATLPENRSAPSALHVPPETDPWPETLAAPPEPAAPELQMGFGTSTDLIPPLPSEPTRTAEVPLTDSGSAAGGRGGGSGEGVGSGRGAGTGPGSGGRGVGAVLIRGPAGAAISQNVSPSALAALPGAYAVLRCEIRLSQRLDRCRVLRAYPSNAGVGEAALARASEFRFRPPSVGSRIRDRQRITVAIAFPPEADRAVEP